jgi:glycosyltransferase involved in cell wall biosynthesis
MNKPLFVISCPIDCYSGYSSRSRDLVKAIIELDKYDVKILPQRWGDTPWNFINDNPEWKFLENYILLTPQLPKQPEIWAQVTVPNEFQPIGKYNIGFTAGIETTIASPEFVDGCNRMDVVIVSSKHSAEVLKNSQFEQKDQATNQTQRIIKLDKPVEVLFEGADITKYLPIEDKDLPDTDLINTLDNIPESFAYLFLGHWLPGDMNEDRKNVGLLIKSFYETFKNKSLKPALILKVSSGASSYVDRENILKKIDQIKSTVASDNLPKIYLLHGDFTDDEINHLYNHPKVKAMVNLTKGEGFGRPLLEFSLVKKPIIVSNWSGQTDFLDSGMVCAIGGELKNVHPSAANQFLLKESQWFAPDYGQIGFYLKDVFENYKKYTANAKRQSHKSKTEFSFEAMRNKLEDILSKRVPEFPKEIQIQLPKLTKKIELPKLKKL